MGGLFECKMWLKQSFEIIKSQSILKDFAAILWKIVAESTNDHLVSKYRGGACLSILQDEHIQWLVAKLQIVLDITVE